MSLGLSFPICEMAGLEQMLIQWGPWQVTVDSERWKMFGLKRQSSFMPTVCHFCIIIIQHDGNSVCHWSVSERLASFIKSQAWTPWTLGFRVCVSSSAVSCPCSFSSHKTKNLDPPAAVSWVCASTLPLLQGTEWWSDTARSPPTSVIL